MICFVQASVTTGQTKTKLFEVLQGAASIVKFVKHPEIVQVGEYGVFDSNYEGPRPVVIIFKNVKGDVLLTN